MPRVLPQTRRLHDGVKSRGMKSIFEIIAIGYCGGLLASDANLATGHPIVEQPLRVAGCALQPVPTANRVNGDFEQIANTLDGAWQTLDPAKVTLLTWWEREKIDSLGPASLKFFADRGFSQVIGAYCDEDVLTNFNSWQAAMKDVPGITGSMYTTWQRNDSQIEAFGDLWWP